MSSTQKLSKACKYFLGIDFLIGLFFGIVFIFVPDFFYDIIGWVNRDPVAIRILGVAIIALSAGSLIAAFEDYWKEIRAIMEMEVLWLLLALLTVIFSHFLFSFPVQAIFIDIILVILLAGFLYFILKERT
jgi:hypothetical protein